jgi:SPP1 family predicted phage head-tail adaptor
MTEIGDLRHLVELREPTVTRNDLNEPTESWATVATVWAEKRDLAGRERFLAQALHSELTTRFVIHHRSDVLATWRVRYAGDDYQIEGKPQDPDGRRRWLLLDCSLMPAKS